MQVICVDYTWNEFLIVFYQLLNFIFKNNRDISIDSLTNQRGRSLTIYRRSQ